MALIVIASTSATAGTSTATGAPAAAWSAGTAAISLGTGFVDVQRSSAEFFSVQRRYSFLGFAGIGHFYKRKSARASSVTIGDQADLIDFAMRLKQCPQFRFGGAVREVPNK